MSLTTIILAAGKSKRMNSLKTKLLFKILGKPENGKARPDQTNSEKQNQTSQQNEKQKQARAKTEENDTKTKRKRNFISFFNVFYDFQCQNPSGNEPV